MAVERRVTELAGPRRRASLHTARSRNDQVITDVALFVRERRRRRDGAHRGADARAASRPPSAHVDWSLPGYTHLQRAQPVYLGHHLLAYVWMLARDRERLRFVARRSPTLPLGAGALAGVNFDTDRGMVAAELGFDGVVPNSIDAVSNRDFILDFLAAAATCATHLSRLGAELVLWSSEEFGFVELSDAWTSGSSIMPQKKNPDAAELLRGKAPRVVAHLAALHGVMHALPLTYNKDLQEDKEHLFDAVDTLALCLAAAARDDPRRRRFDRERMAAAASDELIAATDIADLLVRRGVPFRESHGVVAGLVRDGGRRAAASSASSPPRSSPRTPSTSTREVARGARPASWLESKVSEGGTSLARVREQLDGARAARLEAERPVAPPGAAGVVLRAAGRRGRARPRRLRRAPRRRGGRHRRDRGLPRGRAGLPRLRRPDAAHRGAVRRRRDGLRLPLLRAPRAAQRGLRAGRRRRRGADPRARADRGLDAMRARRGARRAPRTSAAGPGKLTQALGIGLDHNGDEPRGRARSGSSRAARRARRAIIVGPRIGITQRRRSCRGASASARARTSRARCRRALRRRGGPPRRAAQPGGALTPPDPPSPPSAAAPGSAGSAGVGWVGVAGSWGSAGAGVSLALVVAASCACRRCRSPSPLPVRRGRRRRRRVAAVDERRAAVARTRRRVLALAVRLARERALLEDRLGLEHEVAPDQRREGAAGDRLAAELGLHRRRRVRVADPDGDRQLRA